MASGLECKLSLKFDVDKGQYGVKYIHLESLFGHLSHSPEATNIKLNEYKYDPTNTEKKVTGTATLLAGKVTVRISLKPCVLHLHSADEGAYLPVNLTYKRGIKIQSVNIPPAERDVAFEPLQHSAYITYHHQGTDTGLRFKVMATGDQVASQNNNGCIKPFALNNQLSPDPFNIRLPVMFDHDINAEGDCKMIPRIALDTIMQSPFRGEIEYISSATLSQQPFMLFREAKSGVVFKIQSVELWLHGIASMAEGELIEVSLEKHPENTDLYRPELCHFWHITALHSPNIPSLFEPKAYDCSVMTDWHSLGKANILENTNTIARLSIFSRGAFIQFALSHTIQGALLVSKHVLIASGYQGLSQGSALNVSLAVNPSHHTERILPVVATRLHSVPNVSKGVTRICELVNGQLTAKSQNNFDELERITFTFYDPINNQNVIGTLSKQSYASIVGEMAHFKVTALVKSNPWQCFVDRFIDMERIL